MRKQANWLALLLWCCIPFASALADEWHFTGVKRIVALSDIHGAYDAFVTTLQKSGVIDDKHAWSGGKTHLVITGDLLDRGPESRRAMDLIIRLEREAPVAGGRVHQLLGNHEVMNLIGDLRYVSDEEYAAFLDIESLDERELWYQRFRDSKPADSDESAVRLEFEDKAPPGYFGHRRAFRHDGIYGKWLLKKPLMVVVNDTAFVHGGVPPYVSDHGLTGVNVALKKDLHDYVTTRAMLQDAAVMSPIEKFKEIPVTLSERISAGQIADDFMSAAQNVVDLSASPLHLPAGPTWYRGTATCSRLIEGDELNVALNEIGAHRVVFGHTPTVTRRVQQRMNGRIVEIDTGMLQTHYDGIGHALIIEGDRLSVVDQNGQTDLWPIPHPLRVGHESLAVDDDALASILENGKIEELNTVTAARRLVRVSADEQTLFAYFSELSQDPGFAPELAAFKLDRMLGLGMVPVTVRREIAGRDGTLQFVPPETRTERERVADGEQDNAPCPLEKQVGAMFVFDSLIYNAARTPSTMLYSPEDWLLMLVENENSFGADQGRPAYLKDIDLKIGEQWRTALLLISDETLRTNLGEVLDKRRISALAKRRDALLEDSKRPRRAF